MVRDQKEAQVPWVWIILEDPCGMQYDLWMVHALFVVQQKSGVSQAVTDADSKHHGESIKDRGCADIADRTTRSWSGSDSSLLMLL